MMNDLRGKLAFLVLAGYLAYIGLQALLGYLGLPDIINDAIGGLQAMVTLVLGFYFGMQSGATALEEKDKQISILQEIALQSIASTQSTQAAISTAIKRVIPPDDPEGVT